MYEQLCELFRPLDNTRDVQGAKAPSIKDHMLNAYVNMTFSQEDQVARMTD